MREMVKKCNSVDIDRPSGEPHEAKAMREMVKKR